MEESREDLLSDDGADANFIQPTESLGEDKNSNHNSDQSEDEQLVRNIKKRTEIFSDSESGGENVKKPVSNIATGSNSDWSGDEQSSKVEAVKNLKSKPRKSRIKNFSSSDDSDSGNGQKAVLKEDHLQINTKQSSRLNNKRNNLRDKLQSLQKIRKKNVQSQAVSTESVGSELDDLQKLHQKSLKKNMEVNSKTQLDSDPQCVSTEFVRSDFDDSSSSNEAADEEASIEKIKQIIKERSTALKSTLLIDPDTSSDDDGERKNAPPKYKKKRAKQSSSSPKPVRMSAKQAMENMQKIKSESNRMLREKEVTLPYHRPKALTLKDIMSRRKTVLTPDGKALPLKMNDEQLKLYAQSLEQRQKEMIELCKSDTEDEDAPEEEENNETSENVDNNLQSNEMGDDDTKTDDVNTNKEDTTAQDNDTSFDVMIHGEKTLDEQTVDGKMEAVGKQDSNEKCEDPIHDSESQKSCDMLCLETENSKETIDNNNSELEIHTKDSCKTDQVRAGSENQENIISEERTLISKTNSEIEKPNIEPESQLISLHYSENIDSEPQENTHFEKPGSDQESSMEIDCVPAHETPKDQSVEKVDTEVGKDKDVLDEIDNFSDDDINMDDIDRLIENADIIESTQNSQPFSSPMLIKDVQALTSKPRLAGAPGSVIDLDGRAAAHPRQLSGVELLKQRFTYFAGLKTPEEIERAREKRIKPGFQHLRLKQELEEKIAEQKSLEWAKRLEEEKQHHMEMEAIRGDGSDEEDDIDKIEAKLAETEENVPQEDSDSAESEPEENDMDITDKPRKNNPLLDDEAEESENEEVNKDENAAQSDTEEVDNADEEFEQNDESDEESSDDGSSDDEEVENKAISKKSRILKAFEDSDDETAPNEPETESSKVVEEQDKLARNNSSVTENVADGSTNSQDDEIQSAQFQKSISEDLFSTQDLCNSQEQSKSDSVGKDLESNSVVPGTILDSEKTEKLSVICETQPYDDSKFDDIVGMCSGSFSQNIANTQVPATDKAATQDIGDDVLALCTGKFYDNEFVSPQEIQKEIPEKSPKEDKSPKKAEKTTEEGNLLKSILLELDDPEFDDPKPNKFFLPNSGLKQQKKRFMIDSDDEAIEPTDESRPKKLKKKKLKDRALQISDDEDELSEEENGDDFMSAEEGEMEDDAERLVEYDSEENEVAVPALETKKKKRRVGEFFENEAELTSEDEWLGSGDEDEAGLDRMEREEGDSEKFNQHQLQRELGQIHMRDVLDQDKREVRLLQELLLEDGDLGGGSRQRKFRWRNADGEEETGTVPDDLADTQDDDFESEEQWRKQRHEREVFLRQMMQKEGEENESLNTSINRTTIIKANLVSKTMSSLLLEVNSPKEKTETPVPVQEKKSAKDIPSPAKKPFNVLQQNYRGSLLSRGKGALARLAAIAAPLAGDSSEDAPKMGSMPKGKSNFVFATLSPSTDQPKVSKRKNDGNVGTPQLMKKLKTDEKTKDLPRISLLEHLKT